MGQPEGDRVRRAAMNMLGNGLFQAKHYEDALPVKEAELSTLRRLGDSEYNILVVQGNLASSYQVGGRLEDALRICRDVYSGHVKLNGEEHIDALRAAFNSVTVLFSLKRHEEAKALILRTIPVARRTLGETHDITLQMRSIYANVLFADPGATLDDLREAVETLEETERIARRVLGGANPTVRQIVHTLQVARLALRAGP